MTANRIYGVYPGIYKNMTNEISKMSEGELWIQISNMEEKIKDLMNDENNNLSKTDFKLKLKEYQYSLEYLINKTSRFGVEIERKRIGKHIAKNESFNAWFEWWQQYFKSFSSEEAHAFNTKLASKENVNDYRPDGNWQEEKITKRGR